MRLDFAICGVAAGLQRRLSYETWLLALLVSSAQVSIEAVHGINGLSVETTMRNIGRIASPGMEKTEETILSLMMEKTGEMSQ